MQSNFEACLAVVLASEGGFVDDPADPGGATNLGITLATLSSWRRTPQTIADVEALTVADVAPIYLARYWNPVHGAALAAGVDLMVFDEAVNQGVGRAIESLQRGVGVAVDGLVGPATAAAVAADPPASLIVMIQADREAHYRALPTFWRFGDGWLARLKRTAAAAQAMAKTGAHEP